MEFIVHTVTELPSIRTHILHSWNMHCNVNLFYK